MNRSWRASPRNPDDNDFDDDDEDEDGDDEDEAVWQLGHITILQYSGFSLA